MRDVCIQNISITMDNSLCICRVLVGHLDLSESQELMDKGYVY
jgi:hypothetical protein